MQIQAMFSPRSKKCCGGLAGFRKQHWLYLLCKIYGIFTVSRTERQIEFSVDDIDRASEARYLGHCTAKTQQFTQACGTFGTFSLQEIRCREARVVEEAKLLLMVLAKHS